MIPSFTKLIILILLFLFQIQPILTKCKPGSGIKSPLDVFFHFFRNSFSNLNQRVSRPEFTLIFHFTTLSEKNYFIFKESSISKDPFFYGFQMELDSNGNSVFPQVIKHSNLEVVKIVLELDSHPINPDNKICSDLNFSLMDYQRYCFFFFL